MTTRELASLGFTPVVDAADNEVRGGFCGDLLSWVMGRAKAGDVLFTVMGNLNTVAVATLADIAAVVLCQGVELPDDALEKAREEGVDVFYTGLPVYEAATKFYEYNRLETRN